VKLTFTICFLQLQANSIDGMNEVTVRWVYIPQSTVKALCPCKTCIQWVQLTRLTTNRSTYSWSSFQTPNSCTYQDSSIQLQQMLCPWRGLGLITTSLGFMDVTAHITELFHSQLIVPPCTLFNIQCKNVRISCCCYIVGEINWSEVNRQWRPVKVKLNLVLAVSQ